VDRRATGDVLWLSALDHDRCKRGGNGIGIVSFTSTTTITLLHSPHLHSLPQLCHPHLNLSHRRRTRSLSPPPFIMEHHITVVHNFPNTSLVPYTQLPPSHYLSTMYISTILFTLPQHHNTTFDDITTVQVAAPLMVAWSLCTPAVQECLRSGLPTSRIFTRLWRCPTQVCLSHETTAAPAPAHLKLSLLDVSSSSSS
jgi:hypothetical protein